MIKEEMIDKEVIKRLQRKMIDDRGRDDTEIIEDGMIEKEVLERRQRKGR